MKYGSNIKISKKGFTLMELMVVVLLIAVLAAIAIPFYNDAIDSQNNERAKAILETLNGGVERFQREHNIAIPTSAGAARNNNAFTNIGNNVACSYRGQTINGDTFTLQNFITQLIACGYVPKGINYDNLDYVFRLQNNNTGYVCGRGYVYMEPRAEEGTNRVNVGSKYCIESTDEGTPICTYCAGIEPYSGKAIDTIIGSTWNYGNGA